MIEVRNLTKRYGTNIALDHVSFSVEEGLPPSLSYMLHEKPHIRVIKLHLDNDSAGRTYTQAIIEIFQNDYQVINAPPPCGKDVNDYLMMKLKQMEERSQNGAGKNFIHESQRA